MAYEGVMAPTPTISNVQAPTTTPVGGWAHAEFIWYVSGVSKDPASDSSLVIPDTSCGSADGCRPHKKCTQNTGDNQWTCRVAEINIYHVPKTYTYSIVSAGATKTDEFKTSNTFTPTISNVQAPTTTPVRGWAHAEFSWYVSGVSKDPASDSSLVIPDTSCGSADGCRPHKKCTQNTGDNQWTCRVAEINIYHVPKTYTYSIVSAGATKTDEFKTSNTFKAH